jgi:hypothetical protein
MFGFEEAERQLVLATDQGRITSDVVFKFQTQLNGLTGYVMQK